MRVSVSADERTGVADSLAEELRGRWNDANVLALSLRSTSHAELGEILDAWFVAQPSADAEDVANVEHIRHIS